MIDKDVSHAISYLRLPLALLIVFGHANILAFPIYSNGEICIYNQSIISYPVSLFSLILFGSAVPLFFMVSGYLFFINETNFNINIYKKKLSKRVYTLLIPYLIWNIVYVAFNSLTVLYNGAEICLLEQLESLWVMKGSSYPADPALWFVRDLIVCMIFSPLIHFICKRKKIFSLFFIFLFALWLTNSFQDKIVPGISVSSILFFLIGANIGINKVNIKESLVPSGGGIMLIWLSLVILVLVLKQYPTVSTGMLSENKEIVVVYRLANFFGCAVYMYLGIMASIFLQLKISKTDHSFIVFSAHMLILMILRKVIDMTISTSVSPLIALLIYVLLVSTGFFGSLIISKLIHTSKLLSKLLAGGR